MSVEACGMVDGYEDAICNACTTEDLLNNRIYDCTSSLLSGGACPPARFGLCSQLSGRRACAHASCRCARARRHAATC